MTNEQMQQLKALALKATPGPWERDTIRSEGEYGSDDDGGYGYDSYEVTDSKGRCIMDCLNNDDGAVHVGHDGGAWDEVAKRNAAYVAAASPDVILALIAKVESLAAPSAANGAPAGELPLMNALIETREWFEAQRKAISKGCGSTWDMFQCDEQIERINAAIAAVTLGVAPSSHADDIAVDRFAIAMKEKMAASRAKGRGGWDNPADCLVQDLAAMLVDHLEKGDPVDIGNFCMMIWNRMQSGYALGEFDIITAAINHRPARAAIAALHKPVVAMTDAKLVAALKELCAMYGSTWDSVDGSLVMMGDGIKRFEKAHAAGLAALAAHAGQGAKE